MNFFRRMNPVAAIRDLRFFLAGRSRHELIFAFLAIFVTLAIVVGFMDNSGLEVPYKRDIIYVQSWPLNRSEQEILAQQKIDMAKKKVEDAQRARLEAQRRAEFKKVDDALDRWGI